MSIYSISLYTHVYSDCIFILLGIIIICDDDEWRTPSAQKKTQQEFQKSTKNT